MHARIPADLRQPFEKEIRRIRLRSALRLYVPAVVLFAGLAYGGIVWHGHAALHLLSRLGGESLSEAEFLRYFFYTLLSLSAVATFLLLRHIVTKELYQDFLYCRRCDAFEFDETGLCPVCQKALSEKEAFFFLEFEDERKVLESFGLKETPKTAADAVQTRLPTVGG